jgi:hypothetical protein
VMKRWPLVRFRTRSPQVQIAACPVAHLRHDFAIMVCDHRNRRRHGFRPLQC